MMSPITAKFCMPFLFIIIMMGLVYPSSAQIPPHLPDAIYVRFNTPDLVDNRNQLHFNMVVDQAHCQNIYGKNWYRYCETYGRRLNMDGKKIESGITMTPAIKGEWRWNSDYALSFKPAGTWPAGQEYAVTFDLDAMNVPAHVILNGKDRIFSTKIKTRAMTLKVPSISFMQDPDDHARKIVSARIEANYPINYDSLKEKIRLTYQEGEANSLTSRDGGNEFELTPDSESNSAWLTVPVGKLPAAPQFLTVTVDAGVEPFNGGLASPAPAAGRTRIPTLDSFLILKTPQISIARQKNGAPEQTLSFITNVTMRPAEAAKHLKLYLLPAQHPVSARSKTETKKENYAWTAENEVTPEILALSEKIDIGQMQGKDDFLTKFQFPIAAPAGRYLYMVAEKEMPAFGGYILGRRNVKILLVPEWPHDLDIMQQGSIMTLSGDRKLSLQARGTDHLNIEVAQIRTNALQHFISQTYGDIRNPQFMNWNFDANDIAVIDNKKLPMNFVDDQATQYAAFDFAPYLKDDRKGLFLLRINGEHKNKPAGNSVKRFVLVTDMGLVVKQGRDQSRDIYLLSFASGAPVAGAEIQVLGRNGLAVFNGKTDSDGHLKIPAMSDNRADRAPVAIIAEKGADFTFIPYDREDRVLNMSKFEVAGAVTPGEGLNALVFTDRGIYRPGEKVQIGALVRDAAWAALPKNLPLQIIITDPRGRTIQDQILDFGNGLQEISFSTNETAPSGTHRVNVHIPGTDYPGTLLGRASFRVEDFQPDRLKITTKFTPAETRGWIKPDDLKAEVMLTNLYGTAATDRRIKAAVTLNPAEMIFSGFADYKFHDSAPAVPRTIEYDLADATTDNKGQASLPLALERQAAHSYSLNLQTTGYEAGSGRGVTAYSTAMVSPMDYVVGYKTDANLSYLRQNREYEMEVLALDPNLLARDVNGLTREILLISNVSTLVRRKNGSYAYESVPREEIIDSAAFHIASAGSTIKIPTTETGRYNYRLRDADKKIVLNIPYGVIGTGLSTSTPDRQADLDLRLDKKDYAAGEDIELSIVAPYVGAGLITIESDKVIAHKWFQSDKNEFTQTIAVPEDFSGKAYVSVAFVRDINARDIYMSPLSHATVPFTANIEARTTRITLDAPSLVPPGEKVEITYKGNQPGKAIIYAVDEGILQVARYKTPDPVNFFLLDRALQVRTAQMLDLLMPEYDLVRSLSAMGGDAQAESAALGKHLNPFKRKSLSPALFWSGVVDLDTTEKTISFTPPGHFNGQMRIMAIAVSDQGVGHTEQDMTVRGPLVVTPNTPLFMAPGDSAIVSVTVANNTGTDSALSLTTRTSEGIIAEDLPEFVEVEDGKEKTVSFKMRATDHLGSASLYVTAAQGELRQEAEATLSIRPATPRETTLIVGYAEKGDAKIELVRQLFPQLAERNLALSPLPSTYIHGLARYLDHFPYGCTEQILSRALPQLALHDRPEFIALQEDSTRKIEDAVSLLRQRQTSEGGFSLWGNDRSDLYTTAHALDFLITAMEIGHKVPQQIAEDALRYLRDAINAPIDNFSDAYNASFGVYILTRSGIVTSNEILHILKYFEDTKNKRWETELPAAYIAASYKMMQQGDLAEKTMTRFMDGLSTEGMTLHNEVFTNQWYSPFIKHARAITLMARHYPDKLDDIDQKIIFRLAGFVQDRAYNTLSAGYAIEALAAYDRVKGKMMSAEGFSVSVDKDKLALGKDMTSPLPFAAREIDIDAKKKQPVFYAISESGFDRDIRDDQVNENIEITRSYKTADGKELTGPVKTGDEIIAEVSIRAHGRAQPNIAIVELLPGGLELERDDGGEGSSFAVTTTERREDRLIAFGTVMEEPRVMRYRLRAVTAGTYIVPPPFAESLYDVTTKARGNAAEITVIDAP